MVALVTMGLMAVVAGLAGLLMGPGDHRGYR
jgi:hypothetical protein